MIKAVADTNKGRLIILGLSKENIRRLQKDRPIDIDLSELGLSGHIFIFAGDTEESMTRQLAELIGPETKVSGLLQ